MARNIFHYFCGVHDAIYKRARITREGFFSALFAVFRNVLSIFVDVLFWGGFALWWCIFWILISNCVSALSYEAQAGMSRYFFLNTFSKQILMAIDGSFLRYFFASWCWEFWFLFINFFAFQWNVVESGREY